MKTTIIHIILTMALAGIVLSSCEKWLDVKPKTQVEASEMFKTQAGFKDALTGVYIQMTHRTMYGRNLTWGLVDCIGKVYSYAGSGVYSQLLQHNYTSTTTKPHIDSIWQRTYTAIASANRIIEAFSSVDPSIFDEGNYNVMYGEALALRAFLHFDMLRLFAPSYIAGKDAPAIPYVTKYGFTVTPQSTVTQTANHIIDDLNEAARLLQASDPIVTREATSLFSVGSRVYTLNYFAVKATLARVYHWIDKKTEAAQAANEVINSGNYAWTSVDNMATTEANRHRTFSSEQIFTMKVPALFEKFDGMLIYGRVVTNQLANRLTWRNIVFPYAGDWRLTYFWSEDRIGSTVGEKFNTKLWQPEGILDSLANRVPLIRLPEMYLILAQCDDASAVSAINELRRNRGISEPFNPDATLDQIATEINWEYLREFICEGVMFYHYKRMDSPTMVRAAPTEAAPTEAINKDRYVLPMPDEEIQFGERDNNYN